MLSKLMPAIAGALSYEMILGKLRNDITEYLENPNQDKLDSVQFSCMLFSTKKLMDEVGGADKLTSDIDRLAHLKQMDDVCRDINVQFGSAPGIDDVTGQN